MSIIEYLNLQNTDPAILRAMFGVVLFYCLIGVPLVVLRRRSRR